MEEKDLSPREENDAFSSALNNILSNPQMLSMVSSMSEQLKNNASKPEAASPQPTDAAPASASPSKDMASALGALAPLLSSNSSKADNNRACLLRALKPYLSSGRCEAIEYIIKFSKLTDVIKNLS